MLTTVFGQKITSYLNGLLWGEKKEIYLDISEEYLVRPEDSGEHPEVEDLLD
jgi:hypothetical protein